MNPTSNQQIESEWTEHIAPDNRKTTKTQKSLPGRSQTP